MKLALRHVPTTLTADFRVPYTWKADTYAMTETLKTTPQRGHERLSVGLPVQLETGTGRTWNISASGIYFETDVDLAQGNPISLEVEFNSPDGKLALKVHGSVVRIEQLGGKIGVAVSIADSVLETIPENTA